MLLIEANLDYTVLSIVKAITFEVRRPGTAFPRAKLSEILEGFNQCGFLVWEDSTEVQE